MASVNSNIAKRNLAIALALPILAVVLGGVAFMFPTPSNEGYSPEQPIPFSHKLHAGQNKIDCKYCHVGAEKSRHAMVPAVATCMNCHTVVKTDSPHIKKIHDAWKSGKPIEWVRVHELPDFVFFTHKRHIAAGVSCETCHGDVKDMEKIVQKSPLTMGWCMECHRGQTTPRQVVAKFYPGMKNPHGPVASVECSTCHR